MVPERKRVTVMLHDRLTARTVEIAAAMKVSPNELVNRFVEGCLQQVDRPRRPADPIPIVDQVRARLRRNLSPIDRWVQKELEGRVLGWADKTQLWRDLILEELKLSGDEELTDKTIAAARERADKRWKAELRGQST